MRKAAIINLIILAILLPLLVGTHYGGGGSGSGDVTGPASGTDTAFPKFSGASGKSLQDSVTTEDASGNVTITGTLGTGGAITSGKNGTDGGITLYNELGGTDYNVVFQLSASQSMTTTYTLPVDDGTSSQYLQTNGSGVLSWATPAASGDVVGPSSATDNAFVRFDSTTGKLVQNITTCTLDDSGNADFNGTIKAGSGDVQIVNAAGNLDGSKIANADLGVITFTSGSCALDADTVALTTNTTGNYVASVATGSGLSGGAAGSEGATLTLSLGNLTVDWTQAGAYDVVLGNAAAELKIMESAGDTYYAIFDVSDLSGNETFTFTTGGTVYTSGNHPYDTETEVDAAVSNNGYLTANQTITLGGDASGSGTTSITVAVSDDSHSHGDSTVSDTITVGASGSVNDAAIPSGVTRDTEWNTAAKINAATTDADFLTENQTITLSGDVSGSGTTEITVTVADESHAHTTTSVSGLDVSADTNLSAGSGIVLTGDALSHDTANGYVHIPASGASAQLLQYSSAGTAKWVTASSDVSIADGGAMTVADESHAHTTTTISGLDVSADLNLTAGDHITLTDDDLDIDDDFLLNTTDTSTGAYTLGTIQSGANGADGQYTLYSEQGETDYSVVFQPHTTMTQTTTYTLPANDGDASQFLQTNGSGALTWATVASSTAYDDIGDPDASGSIAMGAYTGTYTSATDGWGGITISNTVADMTTGATLLTLKYTDADDGDAVLFGCYDNTTTKLFEIRSLSAGQARMLVGFDDNGIGASVSSDVATANITASDTFINFAASDGALGLVGGTSTPGLLSYGTFLGSHYTRIDGDLPEPGMVMEMTGKIMEGSEHLPQTRICRTVASKAVYGAYDGPIGEENSVAYFAGRSVSELDKAKIRAERDRRSKRKSELIKQGKKDTAEYVSLDVPVSGILKAKDMIHQVQAVGAGQILVSDAAGDIQAGDLLESDGQGYCRKQADDVYRASTVARAAEDVKWSQEQVRVKRIGCVFVCGG